MFQYVSRSVRAVQVTLLLGLFMGCLPAARHTLNKSLLKNLPLAAENRVFIRPLAKVRSCLFESLA